MPAISVVMSVYNNERYLRQSIESILGQTFSDFEFLITDDYSDDSSLEIIENYALSDDRIRVFKNDKTIGLTKSLNQMIKASRGSYIARMDADDISTLDRLEVQMTTVDKSPNAVVFFSDSFLIDHDGTQICQSWRPNLRLILKWMPYYNYIPHPSVLMKAAAIKLAGYYNEKYKKAQDWELWNRLIELNFKFEHIKVPLIFYRVNIESNRLNSGRSKNYSLARLCIYNKKKLSAFRFFHKVSFIEFVLLITMLLMPHSLLINRIISKRKYKAKQFQMEVSNY